MSTMIRKDGLYLTVGAVLKNKDEFFKTRLGFVIPERDLDEVFIDVVDDGMGVNVISSRSNLNVSEETGIMVVEEF